VRVRQGHSARDTIITVPLHNGKVGGAGTLKSHGRPPSPRADTRVAAACLRQALELNTEALAEQDVSKVVPKRHRAEAYKQLESLQAQVAQLMRQLMG
jgi:hypothetical protein